MFEEILQKAVRGAEQNWTINAGDYRNIEDMNLWYCGKCGTRKQTIQTILGNRVVIPCLCECEANKRDNAERERLNAENRERIAKLNRTCFKYDKLKTYTLEAAQDSVRIVAEACKRYCDDFPTYRAKGVGIIFCGAVGRGKTYMAAAICNELIKHNVPCKMTSFKAIADKLINTFDKQAVYDELDEYQMLVLDDYGVERSSDYMNEIVETVIDNRFCLGYPMIITTNKTKNQLLTPDDIPAERAISRIVSRCKVIEMKGDNLRCLQG